LKQVFYYIQFLTYCLRSNYSTDHQKNLYAVALANGGVSLIYFEIPQQKVFRFP